MTNRIFRMIFFSALCAAVLAAGLIMLTFYQTYSIQLEERLKTEAGYLLYAMEREEDEAGYFDNFHSDDRVTLVAPDGTVLYDSTVDASGMENHLSRPEIQAALQSGTGETRRFSSTLSRETVYYAIRTDNGNVLRLSSSQHSVMGVMLKTLPLLALILGTVAVLSLVIAKGMAQLIVRPINTLNLDAPLENDVYDELSPLLTRMHTQREELRRRMQELAENRREFAAVTKHMLEGMVLLSGNGDILSINESAEQIFHVQDGMYTGHPFLLINRSEALANVVGRALKGENAQDELKIDQKIYQLLAHPVDPVDISRGIVILALDITDRESAERSRREFTANVSHELKTPLTSISGYAEIMKNGMTMPEDTKEFASRIYDEATRLMALIEDVLRLSRLDEGADLPENREIDLLQIAQSVARRLEPLAEKKHVRLLASGESQKVRGYEKILDEMVYNLVDNAIKYNKPEGTVTVTVRNKEGRASIRVQDTGIGIPEAHQQRVFERFYRVDPSHARETGGTGLGLSIVKHSAAVHGAALLLESKVGEGTAIEIVFPEEG